MATPRKPALLGTIEMAQRCVEEARDIVKNAVIQKQPELRLQELHLIIGTLQLHELISIRKYARDQMTFTPLVNQMLEKTEALIKQTERRIQRGSARRHRS